MEKAMSRDKIHVNDRQLACAHISSREGQNYLKGMAAAANYAWVNRTSMTFLTRQVQTVIMSIQSSLKIWLGFSLCPKFEGNSLTITCKT